MLTWLLNNDAGNGLNVANNVNVNDVNDVNGASNVNTVADEKKLVINQFPNISIGKILSWLELFPTYL